MTDVVLSHACHFLPPCRPLAGTSWEEVYGASRLVEHGLRDFAVHTGGVEVLLAQVLDRFFAGSEVDPGSIDHVLFATHSFWAFGETGDRDRYVGQRIARVRNAMYREMTRYGLIEAIPTGIYMHGSGNLGCALIHAQTLVRAGKARRVLVVTFDICDSTESRIVPPGISILSDAGAACLISVADAAPPSTGAAFRVRRTFQLARPELADDALAPDQFRYTFGVVQALKQVGHFFAESSDGPPDLLITNNYSGVTMDLIAKHVVPDGTRRHRENVARFGHAFSSDCLINLSDAVDAGSVHPGRPVALLSTGPTTWNACELVLCERN